MLITAGSDGECRPYFEGKVRTLGALYFIYLYYLTRRPVVSATESVEMWKTPIKLTAASRQGKKGKRGAERNDRLPEHKTIHIVLNKGRVAFGRSSWMRCRQGQS